MKKKFLICTALLIIVCSLFTVTACNASDKGGIKTITKPYIAQYECVEATYGGTDFLKNYEYIRVIFLNGKELEVSLKRKGEKKHSVTCPYTVDPKTREFHAEVGILGMKFSQSAVIKDGQFTISRQIMNKELFFRFEAQ